MCDFHCEIRRCNNFPTVASLISVQARKITAALEFASLYWMVPDRVL